MTLRRITTAFGAATVACFCDMGVAVAQDGPFRAELTPFAGYRVGGEFEEEGGDRKFELNESNAYGVILNIREYPDAQWEVLYARQSAEVETQAPFAYEPVLGLDVEYLHFGGT